MDDFSLFSSISSYFFISIKLEKTKTLQIADKYVAALKLQC